MPFKAVAQERLYEQVARQVADLIGRGELKRGERLPAERDLARRLGISRPTVREAMIALEIAGLVEVRTGSGIYVRDEAGLPQITFDAGPGAFDLLAARRMIEPEIAAAAAQAATAATVAVLDATIARLSAAQDHVASQDPDRDFHLALARATGNGVLVGIVEGLWTAMFSPLFNALSARTGLPDNRRMTIADHTAVRDRVAARDPDGARAAMRAHLEHVEAILEGAAGAEREVA